MMEAWIKIILVDLSCDLTSGWQPSGLAWGSEDSLGWSRATSYTLPFCSHLRGCISHMIRELLSEEDSFGWSRATSYYTRLSVFIWRGMMVRMMVRGYMGTWQNSLGWSRSTSYTLLSVFICPMWMVQIRGRSRATSYTRLCLSIFIWWYVGAYLVLMIRELLSEEGREDSLRLSSPTSKYCFSSSDPGWWICETPHVKMCFCLSIIQM